MRIAIERAIILLREWKIIKNLTLRNIKVKYKNTVLGFFWALLQPLCTIVIFCFVFSYVLETDTENFPLFLCVGILPWMFFANSLGEATASVISNSNLVLKINFPLAVLPLSYCLSNLIDFLFALIILLPILYVFGTPIPLVILLHLFPIIVCHLLFIMGLSLMLSVAHVFYKDIGHLLTVVLMFWFYLTPILYPLTQVPQEVLAFYYLNPTIYFIEGYRGVLFDSAAPQLLLYGKMLGVGLVFLLTGWLVFINKERDMVKEL
ncbi:MAG: ABC transporter permease [Candidatus Omnitrophica bacterium]|nr:ABC transporter permease [Candidatus Omnitrophota bacterium]